MTRWLLASFSFALVVLTADGAYSAPAQCDPKYPKHCEQRLATGEVAAFSGHLLSPELAISLGLKADDCKVVVGIEVKHVEMMKDLDINLLKQLRQNDRDQHLLEMHVMRADRDRWKQLAAVPFYEEPWLVATVTAVVVSVIFVGASQALR